jgi:hypothetical protein
MENLIIPASTGVSWLPDGSFTIIHERHSRPVEYASAEERCEAARREVNALLDDVPRMERVAATDAATADPDRALSRP